MPSIIGIIKCEMKTICKGALFNSLFLINQEKFMVSAWARGGRQNFNFTFFCHFDWPVSLILIFIVQKIGEGGNAELKIYCDWPYHNHYICTFHYLKLSPCTVYTGLPQTLRELIENHPLDTEDVKLLSLHSDQYIIPYVQTHV